MLFRALASISQNMSPNWSLETRIGPYVMIRVARKSRRIEKVLLTYSFCTLVSLLKSNYKDEFLVLKKRLNILFYVQFLALVIFIGLKIVCAIAMEEGTSYGITCLAEISFKWVYIFILGYIFIYQKDTKDYFINFGNY